MTNEGAMSPQPEITDIQLRFTRNGHDGLVAWASCIISNTIKLDNIAIRRGRDGRLFLTYPAKARANGDKFHLFHPITSEASAAIAGAILGRVAVLVAPESTATQDEGAV